MSENKNNNLEQKLEALGKGVNVRNDFTDSVMARVRQCPQPKAAGTNRFRRLIMNKPILKWLPPATAAAILIIVLMIMPSSDSGIVLADVLQKFNNARIIKINASQNKENGEVINAQFWLDVSRQVIIAQQSDDTAALIDINNKVVSLYKNNEKIQSLPMTDEYLKIYQFDGDMLGWMLRILGKEIPNLDVSIENWDKRSDDDKQVIFIHQLDTGSINGELKLFADKESERLNSFEAVLKYAGKSEQKIYMEFEYPAVFPEFCEKQAEMEIVEEQLNELDKESEGQKDDNKQTQNQTGTLLAEVINKLNGTKIIKMVADMQGGYGSELENVQVEYWLDVNNQIITVEASDGTIMLFNLSTKEQKMFRAGVKFQETNIPDELMSVMRCDGDMLAWIMKMFGNMVPGLETDIRGWDIKDENDKIASYHSPIESQNLTGGITLTIDKSSARLINLDLSISDGRAEGIQSMKAKIEYPDTMPEIAVREIELSKVNKDIKQLEKHAKEYPSVDTANAKGFKITGRLIDKVGNPVEGLYYSIKRERGAAPNKTDAAGEFTDSVSYNPFSSDDEVKHIVLYNNDYSMGADVSLRKADNGKHFDIVLKPTYNFVGKLDYVDGAISEKAEITLYAYMDDADGLMSNWRLTELVVKPDGSFIIPHLPQGRNFSLSVSGPVVKYKHVKIKSHNSGGDFDTGTIKVEYKEGFGPDTKFDRTIKGRVVDENGNPLWGVNVEVSYLGYSRIHSTNSKGKFESEKMPTGFAIGLRVLNAYGYGWQNCLTVGSIGKKYYSSWGQYIPCKKSDEFDTEVYISDRYCGHGCLDVDIVGKDEVMIKLQPLGFNFVGKPLPEFNFSQWWINGPVKLEDYRGKVVLLELGMNADGNTTGFNQWLGQTISMYNQYHDDGLEVIATHSNSRKYGMSETEAAEWKSILENKNIPFPVAYESKDSYESLLDQRGGDMNCWYLVDRSGNYRGPATRKNVYKKIKELLAEEVISQADKEFRLFGFIFDDMIAAMKQYPWLYQYMDNGSNISQWWICPEEKVTIHDYNGDVTYRDYKTKEVLWYYKKRNEIEQTLLVPSGIDVDFDDKEQMDQAFNRPYEELEKFRNQIEYHKTKPEVSRGTYRGQDVRILKYVSSDEKLNIGDGGCCQIMYLDAEQDLLRGYICWSHSYAGPDPKTAKYIGVERVEVAYDYPDPGPESIYDVGVPKDAKVVDRLDEKFVEFLPVYKEYKSKGLAKVACVINFSGCSSVYYIDGGRYRHEHYKSRNANNIDNFNLYVSMLRKLDSLESIEIFDGKSKWYFARHNGQNHYWKVPEVYYDIPYYGILENHSWPDIDYRAEIVKDVYSKEHGFVCVKYTQKIIGQENDDIFWFYLNPEKDYLCHKEVIEWGGGSTQVSQIEKYQQVNGLWYPLKVKHGSKMSGDKELDFHERSVFFIDETPQFGDEVFDGQYVEELYEKNKDAPEKESVQ